MKKLYTTPEFEMVNTPDVVTTSGDSDVTTGLIPLNSSTATDVTDNNFNL